MCENFGLDRDTGTAKLLVDLKSGFEKASAIRESSGSARQNGKSLCSLRMMHGMGLKMTWQRIMYSTVQWWGHSPMSLAFSLSFLLLLWNELRTVCVIVPNPISKRAPYCLSVWPAGTERVEMQTMTSLEAKLPSRNRLYSQKWGYDCFKKIDLDGESNFTGYNTGVERFSWHGEAIKMIFLGPFSHWGAWHRFDW